MTTTAHNLDDHTDVTAYPQSGVIPVGGHTYVSQTLWFGDQCFTSSPLVVWYFFFFTGTAVGGHSAGPCFVINIIIIIIIVGSV